MKIYNTVSALEKVQPQWSALQEVQLTYRNKMKASQRPKINMAEDALSLFRTVWNEEEMELVESFKMLLLNNANKVLGVYHGSTGGTAGTIVDIRILLTVALKSNACKIIVAHNHPSGNLTPSTADLKITERLKDAAKLMDITLLDHLILTTDEYQSFANEGLL
ncbi:JAB domain-containing protein [Rhizosphaericola mali]|uniref:JAB domain-containing protein n=1 Tax=Rhizosphaericola mali TaxID=2545455 RepID=A0A5P2G0J9_9BACT|nr:JAB domain-containing protein [Rhizosphaericola mali]QES87340.1 JAB domain-containing protein [Rhizosphaericola mali]